MDISLDSKNDFSFQDYKLIWEIINSKTSTLEEINFDCCVFQKDTIEINFPQGSEIYEQRLIESMTLDRKPEKKEKPLNFADNNRMEIENGPQENRKEVDSEEFIKTNYTNCPNCHVPIEKIKGCYTMRCESTTCQKKTVFCYLCGLRLTEKTEKTHYGGNSYQKCKKLPINNE